MRLVEQPRLALDDPIARRLPAGLAALVPRFHAMTVAMLLHHAAEVGDGRHLQEGSGRVADARGKLKAGVEPDVVAALVERKLDGSKQYVAAATKLRVRGCEQRRSRRGIAG